jgi:uncharacterized protein (DUF362 family)
VFVGEGPGHVRDTEAILAESRVADPLGQAGLEFIDLNYEDTTWTPNAGRTSALDGFHLPRRAVASDWIVSMPKLKTHHWIGMTAAMKNLYGVLPGVVYGWPKNILHAMGIPQTVYDLTASLPEAITVIDAIDCMEGDGPIMGRPKPMGLIVIGTDLPAVDATCARIMGLVPERIDYLRLASDNGATLEADRIQLPGESWADVRSPFQILDYPHLSRLRDPDAPPIPAARPATGSAG